MQAIIMAAGKGSRLGEVSGNMPKSFVEIAGQKLIDRNLMALKALGITDITIVTGYRCKEFENRYKNNKDIRLIFNPFWSCANVLSSFWIGAQYLKDDFIYLHADTIFDISILKDIVAAKEDIVLPIDEKPCDEEAMKVKIENNLVVEITKEMCVDEAAGEFIGVAKFSKRIIPALYANATQALKDGLLNAYFEEALQRTIDEQRYSCSYIFTKNRFWAEIDFPEDYIRAKRQLQDSIC